MKLIKCRKCGSVVCTDSEFLQNLMDYIDEETKEMERQWGKRYEGTKQRISTYKSLLKSYMHSMNVLTDSRIQNDFQLIAFLKYIRENRLMTEDEITEVRNKALTTADEHIKAAEQEVKRIYGVAKDLRVSHKDPTAEQAIYNVAHEGF
ncbi:MAG: hypothetical protein MJZ16_08340 [Bacteroidales bacterium]|nr:hypothetical protein [Bacteroidales bacterium]